MHKAFWLFYGVFVVGMLMHTEGGRDGPNAAYFCGCAAAISLLVAWMTLRVLARFSAEAGPEARRVARSAKWHCGIYIGVELNAT